MFANNYVKVIRIAIQALKRSELKRLLHRPLKPQEPPAESPTQKGSKMAAHDDVTSDLCPPEAVRGMLILDRSLFARTARVPCLLVEQSHLHRALKIIKPFLLKLEHFKAVQEDEEKLDVTDEKKFDSNKESESKLTGESEVEKPVSENTIITDDDKIEMAVKTQTKIATRVALRKQILLNPRATPPIFTDFKPAVRNGLAELGVTSFDYRQVTLDYHNFKCEDILGAVLPANRDGTTAYSRVGHIVHLNLREHLTVYRHLIGAVLMDKLPGVTLVVNKTDAIGNEFRYFEMEVLAGEGSMVTTVKENGSTFQFDFAKVFWNPRLCTEHGRLVDRLERGAVLYDVFAGVGPFAVPAARSKRCRVLANDLNPASYEWLCRNIAANRVSDRVVTHNLDGRQFLRTVVRDDVTRQWRHYTDARSKLGRDDEDVSVTPPDLHVVMNLPALAVEFLDAFVGLLAGPPGNEPGVELGMMEREIQVHCYTFAREEEFESSVPALVESVIGCCLDRSTTDTFHVRSVAPNKEMIRISFRMPNAVLFRIGEMSLMEGEVVNEKPGAEEGEPPAKRLCPELPLSDSPH